jgi:MFS family permease
MTTTSEAAAAAEIAPRQTKVSIGAWWVLAVLFSLYVFAFVDRHVLTILAPDIQKELALSDIQMGVILGPAFGLFYSIFGLPLGWAADRYPRRWVIFVGAILFGLATAATSIAGSFTALFIARMMVGIGEASLSPAAYSLLADKFPRNLFGTASAIYNTGMKIGTAGAYALGGLAVGLAANLVVTLPNLGQLEPWRLACLMVGAPSVLIACLLFTFREPARTSVARKGDASAGSIVSFLKAEKRLMIPMLLGFSLMAVCTFALSAWTPSYIVRRFGWTPVQYGPVMAVVSLAAAATLIFKDAHVRFYTWLQMAALPVAAVTFFVPDPILFMICYGVLQVVALPTIVFMSSAIQLIVPGDLRGQITAVFLFGLQVIGSSIGPIAVAGLTDYVFRDEKMVGYSMAIVVCTAMPIATILLRLSLKPLRRAVMAAEADAGQFGRA